MGDHNTGKWMGHAPGEEDRTENRLEFVYVESALGVVGMVHMSPFFCHLVEHYGATVCHVSNLVYVSVVFS